MRAFILALATAVATQAPAQTPPVAPRHPHQTNIHGQVCDDPYYWLRDRDDPNVLAYLAAENAYADAVLAPTVPLQRRLFQEMRARIQETDRSALYPDGEYFYYTRTESDKPYEIYCRRGRDPNAPEEILLDVNTLAEGHDYCQVANVAVAPDHRTLAFATDFTGAERLTLRFKDLSTGRVLRERIPDTYYSIAWANDGATIFYTVLDAAQRPYQVWRHRVGTPQAEDQRVYAEPDERFHLHLQRSRSGKYVFINAESTITNEWRYCSADEPGGAFRVLTPRRQGIEYSVAHQGDRFVICTNLAAPTFRLMAAPITQPEAWAELLPADPNVTLLGVDAFADFLALYERRDGLRTIRVWDTTQDRKLMFDFPESVYTADADMNRVYDTPTFRFRYSSLITPETVYDVDVQTGERTLVKRQPVLEYYSPARYVTYRITATAPDGTSVPISLVHRKDLQPTGNNPTLLYGYGAYGITIDPTFDINRVALLRRGVVYAIAHVRGGGALGRQWYEAGKLAHKRNSFTDFIACAEELINRKYTQPSKLAIQGGSAGGLLVGAATVMRPDLFQAVIAGVPFVDVVNTMLDESLPLTVTEYEEWGNPHEPAAYAYMRQYSPYDNVTEHDYPYLLVLAGLNDPRVQYWEPAKWIARLRRHQTGQRTLLLKTSLDTGHGGASGRWGQLWDDAFEYAFILTRLGVEK